MANLLGQNIGTNYKGILNLNTLNGNLSGTLQAVTDGDGNASPLQLSTTEVSIPTGVFNVDAQLRLQGTIYNTTDDIVKFGGAIRTTTFASIGGTFTNAARLHVRGEGGNPVAFFQAADTTFLLRIENNGILRTQSLQLKNTNDFNIIDNQNNDEGIRWGNINLAPRTDGTFNYNEFKPTISNPAGSANQRVISFNYTINNSGAQSGTATGIFLNATETALNGMAHNLMDLQVGGASRFVVSRGGVVNASSGIVGDYCFGSGYYGLRTSGRILMSNSLIRNENFGIISLLDASETFFERLNFGQPTNAFPALKRNGTTLEVKLADDSGFANLNTAQIFGYTAGGSPVVRFKLGEISGGQGISTREGEFSIGLIDANQNAGIRCLIRTSGVGYIDGYSEGTSKATNYRLVFGSRVNNTGTDITNSTTQENGTPVIFGSDVHNDSAIVQINSTTRGFLLPRMAESERDAITTPAEGLLIYNTTTQRLNIYNTSWVAVH